MPERDEKVAILMKEADRRLVDVSRRLDGSASRAGIVIGAALVAASVQLPGTGWARAAPVVLALAAAVLAVLVLRFRGGREVSVAKLLEKVDDGTLPELEEKLLRTKIGIYTEDETVLKRRGILLLWSYICLVGAVVCSLAILYFELS